MKNIFLRVGLIILPFLMLDFLENPQDLIAACSLEISNDAGKAVLKEVMDEGEGFAIRFIHSVALSPVTDFYKIKNCRIYLDKTIYQDFGAGLPHEAEEGQAMKTVNGEIILDGYNRELGEFDVRVGRVAKHALLFFKSGQDSEIQREIPLDTLAEPGKALHFSTRQECSR